MKPPVGQLVIEGYEPSRAFRWEIYIGKSYTIHGRVRPFKSQAACRRDAIKIAKRLNLKLVENNGK